MKKIDKETKIVIYQTKSGAIEFRADVKKETLWATQAQMASVFGVNPQAITKHLKNIYQEGELTRPTTCSKMEQVQMEGFRRVNRIVEIYNLDVIISVGYRISSKTGTKFRQWATKVLRMHIVDGFTINKKRIAKNYTSFLAAVDNVKKMLSDGGNINADSALAIVKMFAATWFSLDAYDKGTLPKSGTNREQVKIADSQFVEALAELRNALIQNNEAGELFGRERSPGAVSGIIGNVFQSFDGNDVYPTIEEKAAHLLYFMVKNHPFTDGNKRGGAFAFVWFLQKAGILDISRFTPEALTVLTLLVAESKPVDKEQMTGLILMLLKG